MGKNHRCQTEYRQSSLIMDPVWSKPVSLVERPQDASSQPSLEDPSTHPPCRVSPRRTATLVRRPTKREVFLSSTTQLLPVSLSPGMIWRRSGTTPSTTNSESTHLSAVVFSSPRPHVTTSRTEKRWFRSCLTPSKLLTLTSLSRPSCPFTPLEEPPVSLSTLVMVSPIPSQSSKVSPFPTPSKRWTSLDVFLPTTSRSSSSRASPKDSPPLPNLKL